MTLAPFDQQKVKKKSKLETQRSDFNDNRFIVCKLGSKVHVTSFRAISVLIFWLPNCLIRSCSQVGFIRFSTFFVSSLVCVSFFGCVCVWNDNKFGHGHVWLQGAGHNDVELYSQYLDRLKQFVSVELAN